ncbi:MAG TPA: hypothetical protein VFX43_01735, partial [Chitinophagaceae bacterium]|nr:hypothetical protein [Chitinophagaceae bacterium]
AAIPGRKVLVGSLHDSLVMNSLKAGDNFPDRLPGKEGYVIRTLGKMTVVGGANASGTLYGCMDVSDKIKQTGKLPGALNETDQPEMVMRGTCIGLQKTTLLPGRGVYEYPITKKNFPWFYNKKLWIKYLDMMVENRYNSLYLWNGHPFASLVRLKAYPHAVEVDSATFRANQDMYRFLTREANKRGIWVIQMFYNIIVSKPFAAIHHMKTQDRDRPIIPVIADYTRKSIAAFVRTYPHVGLLVCLGEAMNTLQDDIQWFTKTIIPGVKDGLRELGRTDEPPIVLRGHDTNAPVVMKAALPLYHNLYTMEKYTGESLTTYRPRGKWAEVHRALSKLGAVNIENVHILSNLEPFRWGSPDFIRKCVIAMHHVHRANGLHLYPQASYWDWPYTADKTNPRLLEMDRDWIWYKAWSRYAWNCRRDSSGDAAYWTSILGDHYGCGKYGKDILAAYETSGIISPMLIRRFGITEGNRQTLSLGMFMSQLVSPERWGLLQMLYESDGPPGEMISRYVKREWLHQPHTGETPPIAIREVTAAGAAGVKAIEAAAPHVTHNKAEFARLQNDMYCYRALADFYADKVRAAMSVLRYQYSKDTADLERALPWLKKSVDDYRGLVKLTKDKYLYANSMQTGQRTIPINGAGGHNKTWAELLPDYEKELKNFQRNLALLKTQATAHQPDVKPLAAATVELGPGTRTYRIKEGAKPFSDTGFKIEHVAMELRGLTGVRLSMAAQQEDGTVLHFKNRRAVKVVIGFFNATSRDYVSPSALENNANANDRGQVGTEIINAVGIPGLPPVNIHTYYFSPGDNTLKFKHGACLILGFIPGDEKIQARDAGFKGSAVGASGLDWLFY